MVNVGKCNYKVGDIHHTAEVQMDVPSYALVLESF